MAVQWEVIQMKVETSPGDHIRDSLFANGQMQVPVIVSIEAINPANNTIYKLSAAQLNTIKLVDYYNPTTQLSTPWTYSDVENEFHHALPATAASETQQTDASDPRADFQKKTWWVSTSRVEHKNIGASIQTPQGIYHTGGGTGHSDSHVTITGISPIHYNMSNVEFSGYENTANGKTTNGTHSFDQDNYYLSSKVHRFKKVQIRGGYFSDPPPVEYSYVRVSRNVIIVEQTHLHYLWPIGSQQTKQAGHPNAIANITVNQRHGALCLTRLTLGGRPLYGDIGGLFTGQFTIWDEYGNWGKFKAGSTDGYNQIAMAADNSLLDEKSSPSEKFTPISPEEAASIDLEE
ncbi:hypothetical protein Aspvir_002775 [Aspergillus viridinutans]|uniref:Uncharacterized protein n=1 Tax=Aspergillus viridinutans TaxID=75553 RepID=A0A9P3FAC4_ASPVI|nr:uncharacterized protein Aspvir_002775 [Aspergillus viridinutans]GIK07120.1 hypothetical protein Aspvir_002775 [Aspergillus viridinutans]